MHETGHTGSWQSTEATLMPRFSVVVPVLDEAAEINSVIACVRSLERSSDCEIIVVDGDQKGGTINVITDEKVVGTTSEKGRAKQMNAGAALAHGEILIFLHADTQLPNDALAGISEALCDESCVGGAFGLSVDTDNVFIRCLAAMSCYRNRLTRVPFGDQAIFVRTDYFEKIGCFKDIPFLEDVELMKRIRKHHDRICILNQRVRTSARRWEKEGVLFATMRNFLVLVLFRLGVSPHKLAKLYRNH